jgi:hypothetical protein
LPLGVIHGADGGKLPPIVVVVEVGNSLRQPFPWTLERGVRDGLRKATARKEPVLAGGTIVDTARVKEDGDEREIGLKVTIEPVAHFRGARHATDIDDVMEPSELGVESLRVARGSRKDKLLEEGGASSSQ